MKTVPVRPVARVEPELLTRIERTFSAQHTLADLLRWTNAQTPRVQIAEIITQDEYTHDVVVPFGPAFLSFDTT